MRLILFLLTALLLTSCGLFKKTNRERQSVDVQQVAKRDCVLVSDVTIGKVDRGVVTTDKVTETTTTTPPTNVKAEVPIKQGEQVKVDSLGNVIKVVLDSLKNTLSIEVDVRGGITRTVVTERTTEHKDKSETANYRDSLAVIVDSSSRYNSSSDVKSSSPSIKFWLFVLAVFGVVGWFVYKKLRG